MSRLFSLKSATMHTRFTLAIVFIAGFFTIAAAITIYRAEFSTCASAENIGGAYMSPDGVITLYIRLLPLDPIVEGEFSYAPGDAHYAEIVRHLSGIAPGRPMPFRPWCGDLYSEIMSHLQIGHAVRRPV